MMTLLEKDRSKRYLIFIAIILFLSTIKVDFVFGYSKPQTISGEAYIRLSYMETGVTFPSQTGSASSAKFNVTMPDGKIYTAYCMDLGKYTPLDGKYHFTGTLRSDGYYEILLATNYMVGGRNQVHPREIPMLAPNPIFPLPAQRVGWFKYTPPVPKGKVKLNKQVAKNRNIVESISENYSIKGAVYGIYEDENTTKKLGEFVTNSDGSTNYISLDEGRYYIKEISSPKGFKIDEAVHPLNVLGDETQTIDLVDEPLYEKFSLKISKRGEVGADKNLSLKGAQYSIKYYKDPTLNSKNINGEREFKKWIFTTNKEGEIFISDNYKVGGDELFKNEDGEAIAPIGTYVIEEVEAPRGFAKTQGIISLQNIFENSKGRGVTKFSNVLDIENEQTISIKLNKKDAETKFNKAQEYGSLGGAIYDVMLWDKLSNKFIKVTSLTTDNNGEAVYENGKPGLYKILEKKASLGYLIDEAEKEVKAGIEEINIANFEYIVESFEDITKIEFSKTTIDNNGNDVNLKGARVQLLKDGKVIDEFETSEEPKVIKGLEVGKTYVFREVDAPEGYFRSKDLEFVVQDKRGVQKIRMFDAPKGKVFVDKRIIRSNETDINFLEDVDIEKIKFGIFAKEDILIDGNLIYKRDEKIYEGNLDKSGHFNYTELREGKYYLKEVDIPVRLAKVERQYDFEIKYGEKGKLEHNIEIKNYGNKMKISKTDITGKKELMGAKLSLLDGQGKLVTSFTSKDRPTLIEGLERGKTYTLREEIAPRGYVLSKEEKKFKVSENGSIESVSMENKYLAIEKKDNSGRLISGSKLVILDEEGKIIDSFLSSAKAPYYPSNLEEGKTYTLRELSAPKGYEKAKDIKFNVKSDKQNQIVTMIDKKKAYVETGDISNKLAIQMAFFISAVMVFIYLKRRSKIEKIIK